MTSADILTCCDLPHDSITVYCCALALPQNRKFECDKIARVLNTNKFSAQVRRWWRMLSAP
jgi:hypothetical protein